LDFALRIADVTCNPKSEIRNPKFSKEEVFMPTYDFRCGECGKRYSMTMSISERDSRRIKCPKCGSGKKESVFSSFFAKTSRKS
jgi:putative FmdB family regulatory protein